jgi:hypothetical protein
MGEAGTGPGVLRVAVNGAKVKVQITGLDQPDPTGELGFSSELHRPIGEGGLVLKMENRRSVTGQSLYVCFSSGQAWMPM